MDAFDGYDAIVTPSGSCAGSARHQHGIVAQRSGDPALTEAVERTAPRTYELSRVPRRRARGDRRRRVLPAPRHLPPDLPLAADAGRRRPTPHGSRGRCAGSTSSSCRAAEECCGFGGTFAVKNADTSVAMVADKARHVRETGAEVLVAGDNSCLMHIGGALTRQRAGVRVMHLAEILAATEAVMTGDASSGMPAFPVAATAALGTPSCGATWRTPPATIRDKRARVVAEVDDWEELRLAGAAIKDAALFSLDTQLVLLEERLTAAGATVRWARDAAEACAIVAEVAKAHGIDEVVKVKSMATQEIGLNEALEAEGIAAWETDLAELIVQLGDDLPSHILVPAIHRNRAEIREIFQRRMAGAAPGPDRRPGRAGRRRAGAPAREVPHAPGWPSPAPTSPSPRPGTLVVVESEGNGRMCLTLPEVLVSVVGIEKVVPTWEDLDVFLRLLPRSSTGERMNPYTSTWTGVTPGDGPQEVARRAARQRPHPRAGRRGRPPGAALHPLLGLPELVPGLRAGRRPRLRLGLPRPDRRDPQPAPQGRRHRPAGRLAAVRLLALRRLLRGVPGAHRHPLGPRRPARPGRRRPPRRPVPSAADRRHEGRRRDVLAPDDGSAWPSGSPASAPASPHGSGPSGVDGSPRPAPGAARVLPGLVATYRRRPRRDQRPRRDPRPGPRGPGRYGARRASAHPPRVGAGRRGRPLRRAGRRLPRRRRTLHPAPAVRPPAGGAARGLGSSSPPGSP